jgi:hypothetical protein
VLITTRDSTLKPPQTNSTVGLLQEMSTPDAAQLLMRLTGRTSPTNQDQADARQVAELLCGYPLAISQMAGIITREGLEYKTFLQKYREENARPLFDAQVSRQTSDDKYGHTLASAWALDKLGDSTTLLNVIAMLDADNIPEYILRVDASGPQFPGYPSTHEAFDAARNHLLSCSLITRDDSTSNLRIHRLVQDAVRAKLDQNSLNDIFDFTMNLLSASWPYEEFSFGNENYRWARCDELMPHVKKLSMHAVTSRTKGDKATEMKHLDGPRVFFEASW